MNENENKLLQIFQNLVEEQRKQTESFENLRFLFAIQILLWLIVPILFWIFVFIIYKTSPEFILNILKPL